MAANLIELHLQPIFNFNLTWFPNNQSILN